MKLMLNASEPNYGVVEDNMIMDSEPVIGDWTVNAKAHSLVSTVRDQKVFPQRRNIHRRQCIFIFTRKFTMLLLANTFLCFWCHLKVK